MARNSNQLCAFVINGKISLIFRNTFKGAHSDPDEVAANAVAVAPDKTLAIPKQAVVAGSGGQLVLRKNGNPVDGPPPSVRITDAVLVEGVFPLPLQFPKQPFPTRPGGNFWIWRCLMQETEPTLARPCCSTAAGAWHLETEVSHE